MDLDVASRESAAATLLGVAYKRHHHANNEASDSASLDNRRGSEPRRNFTVNNSRPKVFSSNINTGGGALSSHHDHLATSTATLSTSRTPAPTFPNGLSAGSNYQHLQQQQHAHTIPVAPPPPPPAKAPPPSVESTLLSMSSIGFGIDSSAASSWGDATEAAIKAIQDAMERSTLRLPMNANNHQTSSSLQISVQLGVPAKQVGLSDPMMVDVSRVSAILPQGIRILPIRVVVGGLHMPGSPPVCTAVACITLQTEAAAIAVSAVPEAPQLPTPVGAPVAASPWVSRAPAKSIHGTAPGPLAASPRSPWTSLDSLQKTPETFQAPPSTSLPSTVTASAVASSANTQSGQAPKPDPSYTDSTAPTTTTDAGSRSAPAAVAVVGGHPPSVQQTPTAQPHPIVVAAAAAAAAKPRLHQSTSIEMLAMISEEMRLNGDHHRSASVPLLASLSNQHFPPIAAKKQSQDGISPLQGPATAALQQPTLEFHSSYEPGGSYADGSVENPGSPLSAEEAMLRNAGNYNYKKLPPGVTTKNNRRLFVKHTYKDYSVERPRLEEQDLFVEGGTATSASRTPNAAFPLKLHETLTQIEANGHGDIIGWMPHGRSFKIHKQLEFAEIILPRYFVMTKKSSFLRQLNLYGFNRFSAGADQGSYYHEKFLRGLKFLCRRMTRQKVNGNRIRSAGNPDDEPVLARFPSCPPDATATPSSANSPHISSLPPNKRYTYISREEEDDEEANGAEPRNADDDRYQDDEDEDDEEGEGEGDDDGTATTCSNSVTKVSPTPEPLRSSGGFQVSFPLKLQRMLDKIEAEGVNDAISWLSHGRAFIVRNPETFVEKLMSVHFNKTTKYNSFLRQLNLYNFQRITAGRDKGAWHHVHFQRGKPHLCIRMVRTKVNGAGCRKPAHPSSEPNLYSLQPLPAIAPGTVIEVPTGIVDGEDSCESEG